MRGKLLGRGLVGRAQAVGGDDRRHLAQGLARFLGLGLERPDKRVALIKRRNIAVRNGTGQLPTSLATDGSKVFSF